MNHIVSISLVAAVTAVLTQPLHADQNQRGGGGHATAPAHASAPVHAVAPRVMPSAPRTPMRAPQVAPNVRRTAQVPRAATQSQALFADRAVNPQQVHPQQVHPQSRQAPAIAQQRNIQRRRNVPSIAFGGSVPQGSARMEGTENPRRIENRPETLAASVAKGRDFKPPLGVYRNWEHGRVHEWNRHQYRWSGGDWVIIDGGGLDTPGYYETAPADSYGTSGVIENGGAADVLPNGDATPGASRDLTAQVQEQISRRGYDAGPVDGVMGLQTRDAIEDFQSAFGLPINGQIDSNLLQALGL